MCKTKTKIPIMADDQNMNQNTFFCLDNLICKTVFLSFFVVVMTSKVSW